MKKIRIFLCAALLGCGVALQAQDAKTCFVNMPDSLSPLLTAVNRADCIDFMESKMKAEVTNTFGGKSQMTVLSPDYIRVQMTARSVWQMKLLAVDDSTKVICTVSTVNAPVGDSHIDFYTSQWQPLDRTAYLPVVPDLDDFIKPATGTTDVYQYKDAVRQADMLLMKAELSPKDGRLVFKLTTPGYMDKEAADKLKPFIRPSLVYVWKQGKFVPEKPRTEAAATLP